MKHNKLFLGVLMILLILAATRAPGIFASPGAGPESLQAEPGWQQANSNGFGDPGAGDASALELFNGFLYAGTHNAAGGARIYRSPDGVTWAPASAPGFGIPHDTAPPAILDLLVFNGYLYASTGRGGDPGQIWRTANGTYWAPVVNNGFSNADTVDITALAEFDGVLYAAATNRIHGVQVWLSYTGDSNSWTQAAPAALAPAPARITGLAVLGDALYAAVESDGPVEIWRTYGGEWAAVVSNGFGDEETVLSGGLGVFGVHLYAGAGNAASGAQLWRTSDGTSWAPANAPEFGDADNEKVEMVFAYANHLYAGVKNMVTGLEVWRSPDGAQWEQSNADGFGDSDNTTSNGSNAAATFAGRFYVGTSNVVAGGELWRLTPAELPAHGVVLSPDALLAGQPGQTVVHTLTVANTGAAPDTFALALSGQTWPTALSTSSITLAAGASSAFAVSVTIPGNVTGTATDAVTVTARSETDSDASDSAVLTTRAVGPGQAVYLPAIMRLP